MVKRLAGTGLRPPRRTRGYGVVEFALCAPLVLLLVFGIIDVARLVQAQVTVNEAARQAVRYAMTGQQQRNAANTGWIPRADTVRTVAENALKAGLPVSSSNDQRAQGFYQVEVNPPNAGIPEQTVQVTVYYNVSMITPLVNAIFSRVLVRGFEQAINEQWGAVQNFDRANIPPTPLPLPTWTPLPTPTATPTAHP